MRNWFIEKLIRMLARELSDVPKSTMTKGEYDGMMSQLWQLPAFRKYIQDRDAKLIWTMAGGEGLEPEPRDKYSLHSGQRVELLILGREAKQAYNRIEAQNKQKALAKEQEKS